jgi:hypothetical protein
MEMRETVRRFKHAALLRALCAVALACASVSGWHFNHVLLFSIGFPGDVVMVLMTGVHGGGTYAENLLGGVVCVLVNTVFFYYLFKFVPWFLKLPFSSRS